MTNPAPPKPAKKSGDVGNALLVGGEVEGESEGVVVDPRSEKPLGKLVGKCKVGDVVVGECKVGIEVGKGVGFLDGKAVEWEVGDALVGREVVGLSVGGCKGDAVYVLVGELVPPEGTNVGMNVGGGGITV
jgi:hypothetical protein